MHVLAGARRPHQMLRTRRGQGRPRAVAAGRAVRAMPCLAVPAAAPAVRMALRGSVGVFETRCTVKLASRCGRCAVIPAIGTNGAFGHSGPPKVMAPWGCRNYIVYLVHPQGRAGRSANCGRYHPQSAGSGARAAALAAAMPQLSLHLLSSLRNWQCTVADSSMQHVVSGSCSFASESLVQTRPICDSEHLVTCWS